MPLLPASFASAPRRRARIEIIPLIDVIFFLLATFVLFTLSLNRLQSVPVELPQAKPAARPVPNDQTVVLQISGAGTAYWNREPITLADIPARLVAYKAATLTPRILVSGDNAAHFGDAVRALDEIREAGIAQVSIETIARPSGR
jgi:biopolymer transport protein ExbD